MSKIISGYIIIADTDININISPPQFEEIRRWYKKNIYIYIYSFFSKQQVGLHVDEFKPFIDTMNGITHLIVKLIVMKITT